MLKGDLTATPLPDVLRAFAADGVTGCLHLDDGAGDEALVYFKAGRVYSVYVPGPRPQLGARLVSSGALAPEALEEALEAQRTELQGWRLGELLVHLGYVEQDVVEAFVMEQLREATYDLSRWRSGRWRFRKNEKTREDVGQSATVDELLAEVARREAQWDAMSAALHGPAAVPVLSAGGVSAAEFTLDQDQWALLCKVDGERSIAELARDCGFTPFEAGRIVFSLVDAGLVDVEETVEPDSFDSDFDLDSDSSLDLSAAASSIAALLSGSAAPTASAAPVAPTVEPVTPAVEPVTPTVEPAAPSTADASSSTADSAVADLSAAGPSAAGPSAAGPSAAGPSAADLSDAELPAADLPVAELPAIDLPAIDLPADLPVADLSAAELPVADLSAADLPAAELPAAELPADVPAAELPADAPTLAQISDALFAPLVPAQASPLDEPSYGAPDAAAPAEPESDGGAGPLPTELLPVTELSRLLGLVSPPGDDPLFRTLPALPPLPAYGDAPVVADHGTDETSAMELAARAYDTDFGDSLSRVSAALSALLGDQPLTATTAPLAPPPPDPEEEARRIEAEREAERQERMRLAAAEELKHAHALAEAERLGVDPEQPGAEHLDDVDTTARTDVQSARVDAAATTAERLAAEEAARLEAERHAAEFARLEAETARLEAERIAAETARLEAERIAAETARLEAETARLEAERLAAETARLEAERIAAETARLAAEAAEAERRAAEEARLEAERLAAEEAAERLAAEEAARLEAERLETERLEAERLAAEEAARLDAERLDAERLAAEEAARLEAARLEAEQLETERVEAERAAEDAAARQVAELERAADDEAARQAAELERIASDEIALANREADELAAELLAPSVATAAHDTVAEAARLVAGVVDHAAVPLEPATGASRAALLRELSSLEAIEVVEEFAPEADPEPAPVAASTVPAPTRPTGGMSETAALLRELSSLGLDDEPSPGPSAPSAPRPTPAPAVPPREQPKKRKGLFGR